MHAKLEVSRTSVPPPSKKKKFEAFVYLMMLCDLDLEQMLTTLGMKGKKTYTDIRITLKVKS